MHRRFGLGIAALTCIMSFACGGDDNTTTTGAAGTAGMGGAAGSDGTSATGGAGAGGGGTAGTGGTPDSGREGGISPLFSFFVTSTGSSDGGNLGGIMGADQKCVDLATGVGAGTKPWHAYLSASTGGPDGGPLNARDRIGAGPWYNVNGTLIAMTLAALHEENDAGMNGINEMTGLDEHGNPVPEGGDSGPNEHDILTGSMPDGHAFPASPNLDCLGWTSNVPGPPLLPEAGADAADASEGAADAALDVGIDVGVDAALGPRAFVGHVNRTGTNGPPANASWNSSHPTPGCSQADFARVGGSGRIYCFAVSP
jgi:hypothetical protein